MQKNVAGEPEFTILKQAAPGAPRMRGGWTYMESALLVEKAKTIKVMKANPNSSHASGGA